MSAFTAQAKMQELKQRLQLQMPSAVITQAQDASGFPAISVALSSDTAMLKILVDPATSAPNGQEQGRVDGLGLSQRLYSPHICEMLQDSDQTSAASKELKARLAAAASKMGLKLIIAEELLASIVAAGPVGFDAAFAAATAQVCTIRSDEINPLTQSS
jgi:hypothetical protein